MYDVPLKTGIDSELADRVVSAARTTIGDTLRSVVYFTRSEMDLLYVRQDIYDTRSGAMEAKSRLVEFERLGFDEAPVRTALSVPDHPTSIGPYDFTVRFHDDGYVVRVLVNDAGVIVTSDEIDVENFEDAAVAVTRLLRDR